MTIVDLASQPRYYAFSYVWGDLTKKRSILFRGRRYKITTNLYSALLHFPDVIDDFDTSAFWIDAFCINQADNDEKSKQIPRMRDIYMSAARVLAWLGPVEVEDDSVRKAFSLARKLSGALANTGLSLAQRLTLNLAQVFPNLSGQVEIDVASGIIGSYLSHIFQREWFKRVWVVQEVSLPKTSPLLICGRYSADLESFLVLSNIIFKQLAEASSLPFQAVTLFSLRQPIQSLVAARFFVHTLDVIMAADEAQLADSLSFAITNLSGYKATVSHDILYGLLGLLPPGPFPEFLVPNYNLPVERVYHHYAAFILRHTKDVNILRCTERRLSGVPTWVSDFRFTPEHGFYPFKSQISQTLVLSDDGLSLQIEGFQVAECSVVYQGAQLPKDRNGFDPRLMRQMDYIRVFDTVLHGAATAAQRSLSLSYANGCMQQCRRFNEPIKTFVPPQQSTVHCSMHRLRSSSLGHHIDGPHLSEILLCFSSLCHVLLLVAAQYCM
jgi:hypothetical protein